MNAALRAVRAAAAAVLDTAGPAARTWRPHRGRSRRGAGDRAEEAAFEALHLASLASPELRGGLTERSAGAAAGHLRALLGVPALALTDTDRLLAWDGVGNPCGASALGGRSERRGRAGHHADHADRTVELATPALHGGRVSVASGQRVRCSAPQCSLRQAVLAPLVVDGSVTGALVAHARDVTPGLVRACREVARWVSGQLEIAELQRSRTLLVEAELRALRAQISPHFMYNALGAIASFVRSDPERARELLLEFSDFARYSFRRHGDFTTLSEELRSIGQYLALEQARFGDRLRVTVQAAPEVLPVCVPFLCLQPLVENAVRHGLEGKAGTGHLLVVAEDAGAEAHITVEDDGAGMDPAQLRRVLADEADGDPSAAAGSGNGMGLANVDSRLRHIYGDAYGLVAETAPGAGTKVHVRVPKYQPGVAAS
ncbi:sensor histidine kinase [Streptomyces sp. TR06-5]|uniref:sensor histidine kinase n=1 Tax=Streptomyces sp. TR06-5 TaxID=3385976 RepID=UPI0039A06BC5